MDEGWKREASLAHVVKVCASVALATRVSVDPMSPGKYQLSQLRQTIGWRDRISIGPLTQAANSVEVCLESVHGNRRDLAPLQTLAEQLDVSSPGGVGRFTIRAAIPDRVGLGANRADATGIIVLAASQGPILSFEFVDRIDSRTAATYGGGLALERDGHPTQGLGWVGGYFLVVAVPDGAVDRKAVVRGLQAPSSRLQPEIPAQHLPAGLAPEAPLTNDLYLSAASMTPGLEDVRLRLEAAWSRPVLMSGFGPAMFAFFGNEVEADEAATVIPADVATCRVTQPTPFGWSIGCPHPAAEPETSRRTRRTQLDDGTEWQVEIKSRRKR
jgi:hypothetical protein